MHIVHKHTTFRQSSMPSEPLVTNSFDKARTIWLQYHYHMVIPCPVYIFWSGEKFKILEPIALRHEEWKRTWGHPSE